MNSRAKMQGYKELPWTSKCHENINYFSLSTETTWIREHTINNLWYIQYNKTIHWKLVIKYSVHKIHNYSLALFKRPLQQVVSISKAIYLTRKTEHNAYLFIMIAFWLKRSGRLEL